MMDVFGIGEERVEEKIQVKNIVIADRAENIKKRWARSIAIDSI